jgi:NTP pyrophosphatase (non-canonical NTP hydrolase)
MPKNELTLPNNPTITDYQDYCKWMVKVRGFDHETVSEQFMLLLEECGEFAKAARKYIGMPTDMESRHHDVSDEAADVFIYLLAICNQLDIDLEKAFRDKEAKNKLRIWTK